MKQHIITIVITEYGHVMGDMNDVAIHPDGSGPYDQTRSIIDKALEQYALTVMAELRERGE